MQRDLADRARQGDHDAFNALAAASLGRLYSIACLILRDRDRAEDATQEALVNAGRHAEAGRVELSLRTVDSQVELRVADDGKGFDGARPASEPGHLGLQSMRERAELMEGELEIESSDRGTRVLVRAPLRGLA